MAADTLIKDDPTLARFRAALAEVYGARIERIVLYGSRARGDARPDSDYDVAVFLRDMNDRGAGTLPARRYRHRSSLQRRRRHQRHAL